MNPAVPPEMKANITKLYCAAYNESQKNKVVTLLLITEECTIVATGKSPLEPDNFWILPLGGEKTSKEFFKHTPPSPDEIEYAINFIEDTIVPLKKILPPNSELYSFSPVMQEIILQANKSLSSPEKVLPIKDMEDVFSRLAIIISGRPYSTDTLPESTSFAASLLILREFMHHLGFQNIIIEKSL